MLILFTVCTIAIWLFDCNGRAFSLIGNVISLVQCCLEYRKQKERDVTTKTERLLQSTKKAIDKTVWEYEWCNPEADRAHSQIVGTQCFSLVTTEMMNIWIALMEKNYHGMLDESDKEQTIQYWFEKQPDRLPEIYRSYQIGFTNRKYGITPLIHVKFKDESSDTRRRICYELFFNKNFQVFEPYLLKLQFLLRYVCAKEQSKEKRFLLIEEIASQMTYGTHILAHAHSVFAPEFAEVYRQSGLDRKSVV